MVFGGFWQFSCLQFQLTDEPLLFALFCTDFNERSSILTRSRVVALTPNMSFCRVQPQKQLIHKLHESFSITIPAQYQPLLRDFQVFHNLILWGNAITLYLLSVFTCFILSFQTQGGLPWGGLDQATKL